MASGALEVSRARQDVPAAMGRAHQLYDARMPEQVIRPEGGSGWGARGGLGVGCSGWDCPPRTARSIAKTAGNTATAPLRTAPPARSLESANDRLRARVSASVALIRARADHCDRGASRVRAPRGVAARTRRQRRDGPGSGARAVAVLPAASAILRAVARNDPGRLRRVYAGSNVTHVTRGMTRSGGEARARRVLGVPCRGAHRTRLRAASTSTQMRARPLDQRAHELTQRRAEWCERVLDARWDFGVDRAPTSPSRSRPRSVTVNMRWLMPSTWPRSSLKRSGPRVAEHVDDVHRPLVADAGEDVARVAVRRRVLELGRSSSFGALAIGYSNVSGALLRAFF